MAEHADHSSKQTTTPEKQSHAQQKEHGGTTTRMVDIRATVSASGNVPPANVLLLQRLVGNAATQQLLLSKISTPALFIQRQSEAKVEEFSDDPGSWALWGTNDGGKLVAHTTNANLVNANIDEVAIVDTAGNAVPQKITKKMIHNDGKSLTISIKVKDAQVTIIVVKVSAKAADAGGGGAEGEEGGGSNGETDDGGTTQASGAPKKAEDFASEKEYKKYLLDEIMKAGNAKLASKAWERKFYNWERKLIAQQLQESWQLVDLLTGITEQGKTAEEVEKFISDGTGEW